MKRAPAALEMALCVCRAEREHPPATRRKKHGMSCLEMASDKDVAGLIAF